MGKYKLLYKAYLVRLLLNDIDSMIDTKVMSYNEWISNYKRIRKVE